MKATGIVRRLDELGRVVIPKELRRRYGWVKDDPIEIYTTDEGVILRKYTPQSPDVDDLRAGIKQLIEEERDPRRRHELEECLIQLDRALAEDLQDERE